MADCLQTLAYDYTNFKKVVIKQWVTMRYQIFNLPNKPLSNIKIIDAAKKLSLYGFRWVFWETLFLKTKLNECGILNLDSSSGDGTH